VAAEARKKAAAWHPHHPETERTWLPRRLVLEGVVTHTEVQTLSLCDQMEYFEALGVMADVNLWHHAEQRGDA
jgi:hypothetical protein